MSLPVKKHSIDLVVWLLSLQEEPFPLPFSFCFNLLICEQRNIRHLRDFVSMKDEDRRQMLRSLGEGEYRDIMLVCGFMPCVEMTIRSEGETCGTLE